MPEYHFKVIVTADDYATAVGIMCERIDYEEKYPELGNPNYSISFGMGKEP